MQKAVLFDVGGVLLTLGEQEYRMQLAERLGLSEIPAAYEENVAALQRGELPEGAFWSQLADRHIKTDLFDDIWLAHFRPIPSMLSLARQLRRSGVSTGILSNTQWSHVRMMRDMGFVEDFSPAFFSCAVGMRKPEEAIYRFALDELALPPEQVAYVDDVEAYVTSASHLGIHSLHHTGDFEATERALWRWVEG